MTIGHTDHQPDQVRLEGLVKVVGGRASRAIRVRMIVADQPLGPAAQVFLKLEPHTGVHLKSSLARIGSHVVTPDHGTQRDVMSIVLMTDQQAAGLFREGGLRRNLDGTEVPGP